MYFDICYQYLNKKTYRTSVYKLIKVYYPLNYEEAWLGVRTYSITILLKPNLTSSNERVSSSSEYRASAISQITRNSRVSRKSSWSEWGFHYFRVSSDHVILEYRNDRIYILEYREDYWCILHISFKSSISL